MANYSLVANSAFQPFSYAELAAPVMEMSNYHEKLAQEYDTLSKQADVLEAMGSNDRDKKSGAYDRYKSYSDALRQEADNLFRYGLNTESRNRLTDMRRRYNTDIVPIQNAWNKREQEADLQMKAYLQNPSLMFTRDASNTSLDEYVANPTGGYGVINGANISAQMSAMAKNLEKQILSGSARKEDIDPYTYNYIRQYGLTPDMIRDWRNNPTLSKMFNQVMQANGVTPEALQGSKNAQNIIDKSTGYAEMGMWNAVGEDKSQITEDFYNRLIANTQAAIAKEGAKKGNEVGDIPNITSDGVDTQSSEQYSAEGLQDIRQLRAGTDGLKASYFGKHGQVNPMKIYDEYRQERKKHTKQIDKEQEVNNPYAATPQRIRVKTTVTDDEAARAAVLKKYQQYGVSDILTERQYNLLKEMGYDQHNNPSTGKARYSDVENRFNTLVQRNNRYSINMTKYDNIHESVEGNITEAGRQGKLAGRVWELDEKNKKGSPIEDASKVGLYNSKLNKDGFSVNGVYYDPKHRGHVIIRTSEGRRFAVKPDIVDNELAGKIAQMESNNAPAKSIAGMIYTHLNNKNKAQSDTDSKI